MLRFVILVRISLCYLGMIYSSKDVYNAVKKMRKTMLDGGALEQYLLNITQEGGTVNWTKSDGGEVEVLFIQTKTMKRDLQQTKPWLFQTDTTFKTNR